MDDRLNGFHDIEGYMSISRGTKINTGSNELSFASINPKGVRPSQFFCDQTLSKHTTHKSIQRAFEANNVVDLGDRRVIVPHSLRGTVATLLMESSRAESSDLDRTGHRQLETLLNYQNLAGNEGNPQNRIIFKSGDQGGVACMQNVKSKQYAAPDVSVEAHSPAKQSRPDLNSFIRNERDVEAERALSTITGLIIGHLADFYNGNINITINN